jgi:hypothetical protein
MTEIPEHLLRRAKVAKEKVVVRGKEFGYEVLKEIGRVREESVEAKKPAARGEEGFKTFKMLRRGDESGVSGTGVVLEGVVFTCGTTVIHWLTPAPKGSISIWDSFDLFKEIHIDSHPDNRTMLIWADGTTWSQDGTDTTST